MWVLVIRLRTKFEVRRPSIKLGRNDALPVSALVDFWPLTLKPVRLIIRGVDNLPTNFGAFSALFYSRPIGQHLSDASRDLATLLRAQSVYQIWNS